MINTWAQKAQPSTIAWLFFSSERVKERTRRGKSFRSVRSLRRTTAALGAKIRGIRGFAGRPQAGGVTRSIAGALPAEHGVLLVGDGGKLGPGAKSYRKIHT